MGSEGGLLLGLGGQSRKFLGGLLLGFRVVAIPELFRGVSGGVAFWDFWVLGGLPTPPTPPPILFMLNYVFIWQECDPLRKGDLKFIKGYNIIQILQYLISIFSLLCYLATPLHRPLMTKGASPVVYRTLLEVHTQKIILTSWQIVAYKRTSLKVIVYKLPWSMY